MTHLKAIVFLGIICCMGCEKNGSAESDPKASFEGLAKRFLLNLKTGLATTVVESTPGGNHPYDYSLKEDFEYDVRKTDSLVSPYEATLTVHVLSRWGPGMTIDSKPLFDEPSSSPSKKSVAGQPVPDGLKELKLTAVLQDAKWVLKSIEAKPHSVYEESATGRIERVERPDITNDRNKAALVDRIRKAFATSQ